MIGTIGNYLSHFNPSFDASFVFFILKKTKLTYIKYGNRVSDIHLSHHIDECYFDLAKQFNLESTCVKSKEHNLVKLIKNGVPLIIELNAKTLSYHSLYKINKWNLTHFITILDIQKNKLLISDCYIPKINGSEFYEGYADIKDIKKAWRRNFYWYYNASDIIDFVRKFDITEGLCRNIFRENMNIFLEFTIPCQKIFANDFVQYLEIYKIRDIQRHLNNISMQIHTLGLIACRVYLKEFLINHLNYKNADILDFIDSDINEWHKICFAIYKSAITSEQASFKTVKNMIMNLSEKESFIYSKLNSEIS